MNRRDFIKRLGGGVAAITLSPMLDLSEILIAPEPGLATLVAAAPTSGTVGGINRATYTFWRNQQVSPLRRIEGWRPAGDALAKAYKECSGPR